MAAEYQVQTILNIDHIHHAQTKIHEISYCTLNFQYMLLQENGIKNVLKIREHICLNRITQNYHMHSLIGMYTLKIFWLINKLHD